MIERAMCVCATNYKKSEINKKRRCYSVNIEKTETITIQDHSTIRDRRSYI